MDDGYNSTRSGGRLKIIILVIDVLVAMFLLYELIFAIYVRQTTGILKVTSAGASLTVSQASRGPVNIGVSKAAVRLRPGTYEIIATRGRGQIVKTVSVYKETATNEDLGEVHYSPPGSSVKDIDTNKLINYLPFIGPNFEYEIGFTYKFSASLATPIITVTSPTQSGYQGALNWIHAVGYNPSNLNIRYINAQPQP